jgi:hypothetical protein
MRRAAPLALALLLPTAPAFAASELGANLEAGYAVFNEDHRHHGVFTGLDLSWAFAPFWALRGGYTFGDHGGFRVHQISAGMRYRLDVFEYVPWIELSPAIFLSTGESAPTEFDAGVSAGLGIDWLLSQNWSIGAAAHYVRLFDDPRFPAYITAGARLGFRWEPGNPFAP